jgi:hypothetical protein
MLTNYISDINTLNKIYILKKYSEILISKCATDIFASKVRMSVTLTLMIDVCEAGGGKHSMGQLFYENSLKHQSNSRLEKEGQRENTWIKCPIICVRPFTSLPFPSLPHFL